jgi:hypothetical protein
MQRKLPPMVNTLRPHAEFAEEPTGNIARIELEKDAYDARVGSGFRRWQWGHSDPISE